MPEKTIACCCCSTNTSATWHQYGPLWPVCQSCWYQLIGNVRNAEKVQDA